ncbi:DUF4190 domain-containing protein [Saccharomonospora xinjiangensis]|uniref:DUF4190 domain-containing protein n=1 Tax=Saccharomonospora xinjiangensis TaxID=75294 RepID=UPI003510C116
MATQLDTNTAAPTEARNGLGTAGFVVGLIGLVLSPLPFIGILAWPLVALGVIFSAVGIARVKARKATNKGLSIAGLVLSVIGVVISVVMYLVYDSAAREVTEEANRAVKITYQVTGDAPEASISYTTYGDSVSSATEDVTELPWEKTTETSGLFKGGSLSVTLGADGGTVECTVIVDGKEAKTATASGAYNTASCSDF